MTQLSKFAATAILVASAAVTASAQSGEPRFYREGNAWVEEISGTLPAARALRVDIAVGTIHVDGGSYSNITYTLKDRVYTGSEESARRQFEDFHVSASRSGDAAFLRAEFSERRGSHNMSADFSLQVPRDLELVRVQTLGKQRHEHANEK